MTLGKKLAIGAVSLLMAAPALAGVVVLQPTLVGTSFDPDNTFRGARLESVVDLSGLLTPYVSGRTLFGDYMTGDTDPLHARLDPGNALVTTETKGYMDFSLGGVFALEQFALWNGGNPFGVSDFTLQVSLDPTFSTTELVTIDKVGAVRRTTANQVLPQVYGFQPVKGEYVRLSLASGSSNNLQFAELAFGGELAGLPTLPNAGSVVTVPEPVTAGLLGLALVGFSLRRTRLD